MNNTAEKTNRARAFFKNETMLCISGVAALLSMLIVKPDCQYLGYINLRVLCLLFCLMAVVQGFESVNLFAHIAQKLMQLCRTTRILCLALVAMPFFVSMFVTNDVALITFVPFTIYTLKNIDKEKYTAPIVALQTVAANIGSAAMPFGNPHNLYLYSYYDLTGSQFFPVMLPVAAVGLGCLALASLALKCEPVHLEYEKNERVESPAHLALYAVMLAASILSVVNVLDYRILTPAVLILMLVFSRKPLAKVDYGLLLTFVFFFIFSGNIGRIPAIRAFLENCLNSDAFLTGLLTSQIISNVPAAVLLSGFTANWKALILGVNVGGLGTPVASLASLISLKCYYREIPEHRGKFLGVFTLANLAGLAVLVPLSLLLLS